MPEQKSLQIQSGRQTDLGGLFAIEELPWQIRLDKTYLVIARFVILFFSALVLAVFFPRALFSPFFIGGSILYLLIIFVNIYVSALKTHWKYYEYFIIFSLAGDLFFVHLIVFLSDVFKSPLYLLYIILILITIARFPNWKMFFVFAFLGNGGFMLLSYLFEPETFFSQERILLFSLLWFLVLATTIFIIFSEQSRQALEESRFRLEKIIDTLPDGFLMYDAYGKITIVNKKTEEFLDVKKEEIQGERLSDISKEPRLENLNRVLTAKRKTDKPTEIEILKPIKRILQITILPLSGGQKDIFGFMNILHDISREKTIERLKTEFVSVVAHQLRTPLSAIKWGLKMLLEGDIGPLTKEQIGFLKQSYGSNERMIKLINDLLNMARIEEGKFLYEFSDVSLEELIESVIGDLGPVAKERQVQINFYKPAQKLPKAKIDASKIRLAIENLIDNAVRYSSAGGQVDISIKYDIKAGFEVKIEDNGVGIPPDQKDRVFAKFFRGSNAIKMQTDGSGLGLFIVKNIIESHRGKIWFTSEENKGTAFYFTIPAGKAIKREKGEFEKFITGF